MERASGVVNPRLMQSVLVGRDDNGVHITWALGDPAPASGVEYLSLIHI